ncbi:cysteine desulfurase-like protein [Mobilicoccus massiliensis]|uniref:cysteine desulfurase-like protein n=1 Tax=Mobilicoccus massiliensis TaxID=1522310 RepID=UPI00058F399D|nr:cysteine desulfurase-like protein [Mobilicoccus massiliensis]
MYDVDALRTLVPALSDGTAYFDAPGGTQTPAPVAGVVARTMTSGISNRGTVTASERRAEEVVRGARNAMADLLGADPRGVVFGRSMTQITYDLARTLAAGWSEGDEVVVSRLDHDANVRPWVQAAERAGVTVRWIDFDPQTAELTVDDVAAVLTERTRLVALTAASNLVGTRPDVAAISRLVHDAGALFAVDGVHATAHAGTDVGALGADFHLCSPYKFMGPHCGVLAASPELLETLHPDKLAPSTDAVPERFELGTLPYELLAGTSATVDLIASLGSGDSGTTRRERVLDAMAAIEEHEDRLRLRIENGLVDLGAQLWSRAARRTPTLLFRLPGVADADVHRGLAERGVNAPAGSFYALECSRRLGLGDTGAVRVGLAPYSDAGDVDRLLTALGELV